MEAEEMTIGEREYITAARSIGAPPFAPFCSSMFSPTRFRRSWLWQRSMSSTAILAEATLSFLGLGPAPPTPTWGSMINDGSSVLQLAPWVVLFPGLPS